MENNFVVLKGEKYYVKNGMLDLSRKEITALTEIEGLESLTNLQELTLSWNQIEAIKGLEKISGLQR